MECKAGKGRKGVLLVVLVVGPVKHPAEQEQGMTQMRSNRGVPLLWRIAAHV
jgi:hypothetical protein